MKIDLRKNKYTTEGVLFLISVIGVFLFGSFSIISPIVVLSILVSFYIGFEAWERDNVYRPKDLKSIQQLKIKSGLLNCRRELIQRRKYDKPKPI